ncbi:hypothetical protein [uncultured Methanobrevibacter sp.]|uniref:hypothetical protein n=1 Tax=uncultured Methanobrevibacter sp. TaxID=253161 RepID=UPI0025E1A3A2|nr:hypothetical protein [uncultured Methanobrevibacter sp.]
MKKQTKIVIGILAVFTVAVTMSVAFAEPVSAKTFKSQEGYIWEIKDQKWEDMKIQAKNKYDHMKSIGSHTPGYSDSLNITVTLGNVKYQGIAFAVQNDRGVRCEVRGVLPDGGRLTGF